MFFSRLITASCLLLILVGGISLFKEKFLSALFFLALPLSINEIMRLKTNVLRANPYPVVLMSLFTGLIVKLLGLATFKLICVYWACIMYQSLASQNNKAQSTRIWSLFFCSVLATFLLLIVNSSPEAFTWKHYVILQAIASLADTVAYLFGKLFNGKPAGLKASPGKTTVGFVSALALTPVLASGVQFYLGWHLLSFWAICFLVFISILGDLVFSYLKRLFNVKDYASYLPGHGGVLDRLDSFIVVVAFYFAFIY